MPTKDEMIRALQGKPSGLPIARKQYGDYDEFCKETTGTDVLEISRNDLITDEVQILNHANGRSYRITATQAIAEGMGKYRERDRFTMSGGPFHDDRGQAMPPIPYTSERTTTHIYDKGSVLCGFTKKPLWDWPAGHDQVSLKAYRDGARISCKNCAESANAIIQIL